MAGEPSFDLDAAGMRADGAELAGGVEVLAVKLEGALPGACRVRRRRRSLFDGRKIVEAIDLDLGDWRYAVRVDGGDLRATREQAVRGVVIKRQELPLGEWVDALSADLREQAQTSAAARTALDRLTG